MTEGVFVAQMFSNAENRSYTSCVCYDKFLFHERYKDPVRTAQ